jgi:methionine synthase II (cobalamin-independent)
MTREVLLIGSVGLSSAEEVFRTCAEVLGPLAPRFPDGETGWARSVWVQCQRPFFLGNPALEMLEPDPEHAGEYRPARVPSSGIYGHTMAESYMGRARLRDGATVQFDNVGYADWALESYATFSRLKSEHVIPSATRFQVSLPTPSNILARHVLPESLAAIAPAYSSALFDEIARIAALIPHNELTIQWDSTHPVMYESASTAERQRIVADLARLTDHVPADVELGFHLCYGDFEHKHGVQPPDLSVCVEMIDGIIAAASRPLGYVHMPVPRDRSDVGYVAPLEKLRLPADTRLYLGLVHYTDGVEGTRKRLETASTTYADFGIATECGMGRRVGQDIPALLRIHAAAARGN